ncbi:hypothetical protein HAZT_HAZT001598 [Hyalella azteca]|uniref:Uncharacterized protein n=1 Tax=Hyalella azteca TaxID=294128 RepID=A0A6A0H640_HYAAZ|nr:hypothetical protein HAZT_HAZT001598 [Hyalella azteca]
MADLTVLCLLVVASLFNGITNPLMKKHSVGIEHVKAASSIGQYCEIAQVGGVLSTVCLGLASVSLVVPVLNSLAALSTALTGMWLEEPSLGGQKIMGVLLVIAGTTCCVLGASST